jgi:hypothetical protein
MDYAKVIEVGEDAHSLPIHLRVMDSTDGIEKIAVFHDEHADRNCTHPPIHLVVFERVLEKGAGEDGERRVGEETGVAA